MAKTITNKKHIRFSNIYLGNGLNATAAYNEVYPGVSETSANANASRLLKNDKVNTFIAEQQALAIQNTAITKESLIADLQRMKEANETTNPNVAIKAMDLMVKMLGYAAPIESKTTVNINTEQPLFTYIEPIEPKQLEDGL